MIQEFTYLCTLVGIVTKASDQCTRLYSYVIHETHEVDEPYLTTLGIGVLQQPHCQGLPA